ncbi:putative Membrane protein [uncultured Desulfobacterium sp.]|uniref:Putative Membrane protein n=1 Tax=uncultured Desulfobacterium sp. TaxID=201089 RepID=A0A445MZM7_9BACT|nr:putative Membrane protein [uncultured Desulfobacterium sp.]
MKLFLLETFKTFSRWRTYISFAVIALIVILTEVVMKLSGDEIVNRMLKPFQRDFFISGNVLNVWLITAFIMNSLHIHIPFLITLVAGDMVSSEATAGTIRFLLIRPPSRIRIITAKYLTALFYTAILVIFFAVLCVCLGLTLFGSGDLIVHHYGQFDVAFIPESEVPVRIFLSFIAAIWAMSVVASIAFLFSTLAENSIGPIIGTMAVVIVFLVLGSLPLDFFRMLKPYFFTTHMINLWQQFLEVPIQWHVIVRSAIVLGIHNICLFLTAMFMFKRKDIKS